MKRRSNKRHARVPGLSVWVPAMMAAAVSLTLGCSKDYAPASYPEESYGYGSGGDLPPAAVVDVTGNTEYALEGEYDFAEDLDGAGATDMVSRSLIAAPPARDGKGKKSESAKPPEPAAVEGQPGSGEPAIAKDDEQPDHGREIIYIAGMQISVYDLENAMATVEALPDTYGGWVHMRTQNQLVLRLPAIHLKPVMALLSKIGVVEARTLQAQDVTAEYVDLESRIKVLRDTQTQLLDLLGKAKTVEEALHVRAALDQVTMELEVALGRMRQLSDLIAYSTLTVTLIERGPQDSIPTSNDPFRWVDTLGVEATEWR
jgi:hypothetical protein